MDRPNILLLVVDCLRADFVFQPGLARVPTLQRLAKEGFAFDHAIAHCTTTTPSFANILTGQYSFEHGLRTHSGARLGARITTLPQRLREAGYHTRAEVSGPLGPEVGLNRGFEAYHHRGKRETIHTPWGQALLESMHAMPAPWFMLLHVWALHRPRQVLPERSDSKFGATEYGRALSSIDLYLEKFLPTLPKNTIVALTGDHGEEITYGLWDHLAKKYRRKFFKFRKKRGLTSRHVSHGLRDCSDGHGNGIYEPLIRVPLIFHGPGLPAGRSEKQVRHIDIAPTLMELSGVTPNPGIAGKSLGAMIHGAPGEHRDAYLEAAGVVMVNRDEWLGGLRVDNKYKYIRALYAKDFQSELYDLEADPVERVNLAHDRPETVADLDARLAALNPWRQAGEDLNGKDQAVVLSRLKDLGYHD